MNAKEHENYESEENKMQQIMETLFDISYFIITTYLGITILRRSDGKKQFKWIGFMALLLVLGDAFHLIPRIYALWTTGIEANAAALGFGKLVTSITMTIFYVILYHVWRERYQIKNRNSMTICIYALAILRTILCLMPQNDWLNYNASFRWGIYRNLPFTLLGLVIIVLFYIEAKKVCDQSFRFMWLAITLSFCFYLPVVLLSDIIPLIGMLMIPKTCTYVWIIWMGFKDSITKNI